MTNRVLEDNIERLIRRAAPPVTETRLEAVYVRFASRCRTGPSQGRRIAGVAAAAAAAVILAVALGGFPHPGDGSSTLSEATRALPPPRAAAPGPVAAPEPQAVPPPGQDPDSTRVTLTLSDATVKQTLESLRACSGVPIELDEGARTRAELSTGPSSFKVVDLPVTNAVKLIAASIGCTVNVLDHRKIVVTGPAGTPEKLAPPFAPPQGADSDSTRRAEEFFRDAVRAFAARDFEGARESARRALEARPQLAAARALLAEIESLPAAPPAPGAESGAPPGPDPDAIFMTLDVSNATVAQVLEYVRAVSDVPVELDAAARKMVEADSLKFTLKLSRMSVTKILKQTFNPCGLAVKVVDRRKVLITVPAEK